MYLSIYHLIIQTLHIFMYHSPKLITEYIVIICTVIYKKEYNNITINTYITVQIHQ